MKILSMVGAGKITAEEAARLLDVVGAGTDGGSGARDGGGARGAVEGSGAASGGGATTIHVRVTDTGDTRVNFALPLGMARFVSNMVPRGQLQEMDHMSFDLDAALDAIDAGATGVVVDTAADDGHHIKVWLE